jgi:hypothetical protein
MSKVSNIQEIFGQFAVELEDGPKLFPTHEAALAAETEFLKGAEVRAEASAYCEYKGLDGKNAKGKANVITDYLLWVAADRPEAPTPEVVEEEEEAAADDVSTSVDGEEVEF